MSRSALIKTLLPLFAIATLLFCAAAPALSAKVSPSGSPAPQASGNGAANVTSGSPFPLGQVNKIEKIGNINLPPAINRNLTEHVKGKVNDAMLKQAKKLSDDKIRFLINQLELYKKRINYSSLSSGQKSEIIAVADSNIAWLREIDSEIQAATSIEAVRALMAQVDQRSDALKVDIKKDAGIMACDRLDDRIATARNTSAIASGKIAALKAQGKDVDTLEQKLADYNAHVDSASQLSAAARAAFLGITSASNADAGFAEGYRQIGLADAEMGRAYADLKDIYLGYLQNRA